MRDLEKKRQYNRLYQQKPEVKKRVKLYNQKPEVKERLRLRYKIPEVNEKAKKYQKIYNKKPENKERIKKYEKIYHKKPEVKERQKLYRLKPKNKERQKLYNNRPEFKEQQRLYEQKPNVKERHRLYNNKPETKKRNREWKRNNPKSGSCYDMELQDAMNNVRIRDKNTCQWQRCNLTFKQTTIHVHHIFPRNEYPELELIEQYMICYCNFHHGLWHKYRGDSYYEIISARYKKMKNNHNVY